MQIPLSSQDLYCEGYGNPSSSGNGYLLGFVLGVGKTKTAKTLINSQFLDGIVAFDAAEVEDTMIGQINMITVSSFCGPLGLIWGYDLARHDNLRLHHELAPSEIVYKGVKTPVFSLKPLLEATRALYGSVGSQRFNLLPGSHVPCAARYVNSSNPGYLYCSISIGIPQDRSQNACLLMEDAGLLEDEGVASKKALLEQSTQSIMRVGENQKVSFAEIFTDIKTIKIEKNEAGCALVAAPYFTLAKNAVSGFPKKMLYDMKLSDWEERFI